jgi:hypothetical protein
MGSARIFTRLELSETAFVRVATTITGTVCSLSKKAQEHSRADQSGALVALVCSQGTTLRIVLSFFALTIFILLCGDIECNQLHFILHDCPSYYHSFIPLKPSTSNMFRRCFLASFKRCLDQKKVTRAIHKHYYPVLSLDPNIGIRRSRSAIRNGYRI